MAYSNDLRRKLLEAWEQWDGTQQELAQLFGVSRSYLQKVLRRWRQTGDMAAPVYRHGPVSRIEAARLRALVAARSDATLAELGARLGVSPSVVCRALQKLGLRLKKKTLHASERDTPRVQALRRQWRRQRQRWHPRRLVFVDESGVNLAMTRRRGRAPRGERVHGAVPQNYGASVTVLGALDAQGVRAAMTVEGATDGEVFVTFLRQVLAPWLRPGEVVVLDNLGAHQVAGVAPAIAAAGAQLEYLPPYSPDLSPMEPGWSKVKTALRAAAARARAALDRTLARALGQITPQDARGWFRLCGYGLR